MISKVSDWLDKQGFTLEMRTAAAFRTAGFEVRQSSHYIDSESGKSREIDVIARDPDHLGIVEIAFITECKSSTNPWVLLCSPDTLAGYARPHAFSVLSKTAFKCVSERIVELVEKWPWLKKETLAAYSMRQALSESDAAYTAATAVAKATQSYVKNRDIYDDPPYTFAFPVIVVNSPILQCTLTEDDQINIAEVDKSEWLFIARFPEYFGTCIRIVSLKYLPVFVQEAKEFAIQLREDFKSEEQSFRASWKAAKEYMKK